MFYKSLLHPSLKTRAVQSVFLPRWHRGWPSAVTSSAFLALSAICIQQTIRPLYQRRRHAGKNVQSAGIVFLCQKSALYDGFSVKKENRLMRVRMLFYV